LNFVGTREETQAMRLKSAPVFGFFVGAAILAFVAAPLNAQTTPTHFAGFPAEGVQASRPTTGKLVVGFGWARSEGRAEWNILADGRIIWQRWTESGAAKVAPTGVRRLDTGYVMQRLTRQGVRLLRSKVLATGLFEDNLRLHVVGQGASWAYYQVRTDDNRLVRIDGIRGSNSGNPDATPDQARTLAGIATLVADLAAWLPRDAWADRQIRAFVPSHYLAAFDRGYAKLSKLPSPAREELALYKRLRRDACQILTTGHARTLLRAFVESGIAPSENHAGVIAFDLSEFGPPSDFHLHPALPSASC
jgi:hypothetical protein